jgi:hypothetical protein
MLASGDPAIMLLLYSSADEEQVRCAEWEYMRYPPTKSLIVSSLRRFHAILARSVEALKSRHRSRLCALDERALWPEPLRDDRISQPWPTFEDISAHYERVGDYGLRRCLCRALDRSPFAATGPGHLKKNLVIVQLSPLTESETESASVSNPLSTSARCVRAEGGIDHYIWRSEEMGIGFLSNAC